MKQIISKNSFLILLISLAMSLVTAITITTSNSDEYSLTTVHNGLSTCFQRVSHSLSVKLNQNTQLQTKNLNTTVECFANAQSFLEEALWAPDNNFNEQLNKLNIGVYEFNKKLRALFPHKEDDFKANNLFVSNLLQSFTQLLQSYEKFTNSLQQKRESLVNKTFLALLILWTAMLVSMGISIHIWWRSYRLVKVKKDLNSQAKKQIGQYKYNRQAIEKFFNVLLQKIDIPNAVNLFDMYRLRRVHNNVSLVRNMDRSADQTIQSVIKDPSSNTVEHKSHIGVDQNWNDLASGSPLEITQHPNLIDANDLMQRVVTFINDSGHTDVITWPPQNQIGHRRENCDILVNSHYESLEQAICRIVLYLLNEAKELERNSISINIELQNPQLVISIKKWPSSPASEINQENKTALEVVSSDDLISTSLPLPQSLALVQSLISDCQGKISFIEAKDTSGKIVGQKFKLYLPCLLLPKADMQINASSNRNKIDKVI